MMTSGSVYNSNIDGEKISSLLTGDDSVASTGRREGQKSLCLHLSGKLGKEEMKRWSKMTRPMRRVFLSFATRFGMRKSGLGKLQKDVSCCEYEDVHVMWEMLNREAEVDEENKCQWNWRFINLARNSNLCRNC